MVEKIMNMSKEEMLRELEEITEKISLLSSVVIMKDINEKDLTIAKKYENMSVALHSVDKSLEVIMEELKKVEESA